ncbi:MAG TPA: pilus assembly protein CpaE [Nakamurella sp.]
MISTELATALRDAGLVWHLRSGDRFLLTRGTFDGEVFTLSDMVVQAHEAAGGGVLAFNGTTEWALDSTSADDALWLPREDQLRELLAGAFRSLSRDGDRYLVRTVLPGSPEKSDHAATDPADAYGAALLDLVRRATG